MSAVTVPVHRLPRWNWLADDVTEPLPAPVRADRGPGGPGGPGHEAGGLDELCAQFAGVCEGAVDPLEICCSLEFEGWSDKAVRDRFGLPDVFALADQMYLRVPRHPAEPAQPPDPWPAGRVRPAVHGLLYGLPPVCFPAAGGLLAGPGVLSVLVVASAASWAASHSLAYLGYLRLGQAGPAQAARLLRAGLAPGMAAVLLALAMASPLLRAPTGAVIFGAGLGAYMLGATVLIVLRAEWLLLAAAAPGVLGGAVFLLSGRPPQLTHLAWAALAATPLLALALAAARAGRAAGRRTGPVRGLVTAAELRGALPSAAFGLLAAGLLAFPIVTGQPGRASAAVLVSLPLAMSMGAAEWVLIWFRRRTQRLLRSTGQLRAFTTGARLTLLAALAQYLAITAALTAVVTAIAVVTRLAHPHLAALPQVAAYLALGGAMFAALLLQAFGSRAVPLAGCAVALAAEIACRGGGVPAQLVACTQLLIGLTGYAALVLGRATRHAC